MSELLQTENITETNLLDAVKRINQAFLDDHKTIQTLQKELAERDERLLKKIDEGFRGTNQRLGNLATSQAETNQRLEGLNTGQAETNQRLKSLEGKAVNLETAQNETNRRLGSLETRLESVETSITQMKNDVVQEQQTTNELLRELIAK